MTLFGCLSFDFIILAFNVLGRTRASIVYLKEKSVNKRHFTYTIPLREKVNLGLFSFQKKLTLIYYRCKGKWIGGTLRHVSDFTIVE